MSNRIFLFDQHAGFFNVIKNIPINHQFGVIRVLSIDNQKTYGHIS